MASDERHINVEHLNKVCSNDYNRFQLLLGWKNSNNKKRDDKDKVEKKKLILPQYCDDTKDGW